MSRRDSIEGLIVYGRFEPVNCYKTHVWEHLAWVTRDTRLRIRIYGGQSIQ